MRPMSLPSACTALSAAAARATDTAAVILPPTVCVRLTCGASGGGGGRGPTVAPDNRHCHHGPHTDDRACATRRPNTFSCGGCGRRREKEGALRLCAVESVHAHAPAHAVAQGRGGAIAGADAHAGDRLEPAFGLDGKTVAVVGLGASGRAAVRLALALGAAKVMAFDTNTLLTPLESDPKFLELPRAAATAQDGSREEVSDRSIIFDRDGALTYAIAQGRLETHVGNHDVQLLRRASLIVLSPGVPLTQPAVAAAMNEGVHALSELAFAFGCLPADLPVAAVSGTNGKSTVATFTGQILSACGLRNVFVGGNLGTPLSDLALRFVLARRAGLEAAAVASAAVVEVSSYQMELPGNFHPRAAAILNLTPDHLERHGSMRKYGQMKLRMFARMGRDDVAVLPCDDNLLCQLATECGGAPSLAWLGALPGVMIEKGTARARLQLPTSNEEVQLDLSQLQVVGSHNAENAGVAALLAMALGVGVTEEMVQAALPSLCAPPHRMQLVAHDRQRDVRWIDDSKATNVEATAAGLKGLSGGGRGDGDGRHTRAVVLLGGMAKVVGKAASTGGSSSTSNDCYGFEALVPLLNQHSAVVTFGRSGPLIAAELRRGRPAGEEDGGHGGCDDGGPSESESSGGPHVGDAMSANATLLVPLVETASLADAVAVAHGMAEPGQCVLLSPGCASFDEFRNFEHRGDVFAELSRTLCS